MAMVLGWLHDGRRTSGKGSAGYMVGIMASSSAWRGVGRESVLGSRTALMGLMTGSDAGGGRLGDQVVYNEGL